MFEDSLASINQGIPSPPNLSYFDATTGNDVIKGTKKVNDSLRGNNGNDILSGKGGNDTLFGDLGADIIYGGSGSDLLYGGFGSDKLHGGKGKDKLIGGKGKDIFKLSKGRGYDLIQDFKDKKDKIFIGSYQNLKLKNKGKNVFIYDGNDLLAKVKGAKGLLSKQGKYFI